jgi:hypothetical protein
MDSNYKNLLQEFCHRITIPLPKYETERIDGTDHLPIWVSTVIILFSDPLKISGEQKGKKVDAEISSARKALEYLCNHLYKDIPPAKYLKDILHPLTDKDNGNLGKNSLSIIKSIHSNTSKYKNVGFEGKTVLIIDIENLPKLIFSINTKIPNLSIYAFVGEHHALYNAKYPEEVKKIISPSTRPDGTDTCIQVFTGAALARESYDYYLIATRDHFGSALVEMISSPDLGWIPKHAKLVTKAADIY